MTLRSKALAGVAVVALLAGCGLFKSDKSEPQASSSSPSSSSTDIASNTAPATTPSANLPPMTKTAPVEGGTPATTESTLPGAAPQTGATPIAVALATVENPKTTLANATVKDIKGEALGEVKSVRVGKSGKVTSINVAIGAKTYALKASTLTYVQAENTIISQKSKAQIAPGN